jgi:hypothetical protein
MNETDFKRLFPNASKSTTALNVELRPTIPQSAPRPTLVGPIQGKEEGTDRARVCITTRRVRCLDPDNNTGSVKTLIDLLCAVGLLDGDSPTQIDLQVAQEKAAHYSEQQTLVEILYDKTKPAT